MLTRSKIVCKICVKTINIKKRMLVIKAQGEVEVHLHTFLLSILIRIKWPASLPNHFNLGNTTGTQQEHNRNPLNRRQLSGHQSWSEHIWREKYIAPARNQTRNPQFSIPQPSHFTELCWPITTNITDVTVCYFMV